jgi:hypothetical protein
MAENKQEMESFDNDSGSLYMQPASRDSLFR